MTVNRTGTRLHWFKSSYSSDQGGACVEIALDWHKSSYSSNEGGACVEVAECPSTAHVRDSKNIAGPQLAFPATQWSAFVTYATRH
jgi:hypothetical protein